MTTCFPTARLPYNLSSRGSSTISNFPHVDITVLLEKSFSEPGDNSSSTWLCTHFEWINEPTEAAINLQFQGLSDMEIVKQLIVSPKPGRVRLRILRVEGEDDWERKVRLEGFSGSELNYCKPRPLSADEEDRGLSSHIRIWVTFDKRWEVKPKLGYHSVLRPTCTSPDCTQQVTWKKVACLCYDTDRTSGRPKHLLLLWAPNKERAEELRKACCSESRQYDMAYIWEPSNSLKLQNSEKVVFIIQLEQVKSAVILNFKSKNQSSRDKKENAAKLFEPGPYDPAWTKAEGEIIRRPASDRHTDPRAAVNVYISVYKTSKMCAKRQAISDLIPSSTELNSKTISLEPKIDRKS